MYTKYLFHRIKLSNREFPGLERPLVLEYYMLESEVDYISELAGKKVYGVSVVKKVGKDCFEGDEIRNLSCSFNNTKQLLKTLSINKVTPVGLKFVLEDMIGDGIG
ncbi:MAG: DUF6514 family protein [Bacillota bacterium]|nr:DUF6514 family protein [Bacillota bacterium]